MKLKIMSSNIWGDYFGNEIPPRALQLSGIYHKYSPDILGLQEMTPNYYKDAFLTYLSDLYTLVPVPTSGQGNYTPLLYQEKRFRLLDCGWEPLSHTPDQSKSLTWAILQDRQTARKLAAISTHFWYKTEHSSDDDIRMCNAKQLSSRIVELETDYGCPVFAFGDFNCGTFSEPVLFLDSRGLPSAQLTAEEYRDNVSSHHGDPVRGEDSLYHGSPTALSADHSLDHIIYTKKSVSVKEYHVVTDQAALDATDHSPIYILAEI
ncbi:MAG: endonuclease/exonuclease/phosphatase family protein [Lachnospiraceae bacterium]|nr:endonuclease/exonuclease/phosphatase family protein [Lachnospiraceae bacterium]